MLYVFSILVVMILSIAYMMWSAPEMDEDTGRVIKPGKTFWDLFKRNNK